LLRKPIQDTQSVLIDVFPRSTMLRPRIDDRFLFYL
jgi:hypothetical protein